MTNDFDQLLRDTLHGRAATVNESPELAPSAPRRVERSRWLLVAATVAAVLVAGGGVAIWGLNRGTSSEQSGGGYARTCTGKLPPAWKAAFAAPPVMVDGHDTSVVAVTSFGDVVTWTTGGQNQTGHVGLRATNGTTRTLFVGAPGDSISTSVDGPDAVLSVAPTGAGQPLGPNVQDIVAIDLRTAKVRHLLPAVGMPAGSVVGDRAAVVLDGRVYWTAVPRGTQARGGDGTVLAYDLNGHRALVVARHSSLESTGDNPAGVFWTGGGVRRKSAPSSVPSLSLGVSDGSTYAWQATVVQRRIDWVDGRGDERAWDAVTVYSGKPVSPVAVSGPFVFLFALGYNNPHIFVMDARTGAVADSGVRATGGGAARGSRVALGTRTTASAPFTVLTLDTSHLPELHC